jgi:Metal-dependent hydrolases of the beta-lactamase superfamily I
MSLYISSLNTGSNGNCFYVGTEQEAILIDAGISLREINRRMNRLNLDIQKIKAVFITHEHTDHTRGLLSLLKKYPVPVYITTSTLQNSRIYLQPNLVRSFTAYNPIQIGGLTISAFPKWHDAVDPHSFQVSCNNINVGVFTDIGSPCQHVVYHFSQCHAAFLEANYDDHMLDNGSYPYHLKRRIKSQHGHLSNAQALQLFLQSKPKHMSHLFLSHLSKNNNCPNLVRQLFEESCGNTKIIVASRYEETPVYKIGSQLSSSSSIAQATQLEMMF